MKCYCSLLASPNRQSKKQKQMCYGKVVLLKVNVDEQKETVSKCHMTSLVAQLRKPRIHVCECKETL